MKSKILAKLSVKYKGLSKNLLGLVADKLAAKVTEESEIDNAIAELDDHLIPVSEYAKLLQQEGDRRVTEAKKTFDKEKADKGEDEPEDDPEEGGEKKKPTGKKEGGNEDTKLMQMVQQLSDDIKAYKQKDQQQTLTEKLHKALGEKKIPVVLAKGRVIEKEEDLDTIVAEIEADHTALKQELINDGLAGSGVPLQSNSGSADKTKVASDIEAWAKEKAPKQDPKTN